MQFHSPKYGNQQDMKTANATGLFAHIRARGQVTRKELEAETGLSWGAVSNLTAGLLEAGYITEQKADSPVGNSGNDSPTGTGTAGRIPTVLCAAAAPHCVLGLDINRSGFSGVVMNYRNEILAQANARATAAADCTNLDGMLHDVIRFARHMQTLVPPGYHPTAAGIAMQGIVDAENGISVSMPECRGWRDVPLSHHVETVLGIPVRLAHDPDCLLIACNPSPSLRDAVLLRLDCGIGMAVMTDGHLHTRPGIYEIGHIPIKEDGAECVCGKRGCLEAYASETGLMRQTGLPFDVLCGRARAGDEGAKAAFSHAADALAHAASYACSLLCVRNLILCGSMLRAKDLFLDAFFARLNVVSRGDAPHVVVTEDGNAAVGAAMLASELSVKI